MLNAWAKLNFVDPKTILPRLREIQVLVANSDLNENIKDLRTNKLKKYREGWEAALFCYGMGKIMNTTVYVTPHEESDFDAIALRFENGEQKYTPIQIKELVPRSLNPKSELNDEIKKLSKYSSSKDCVVVIHINRDGRLELSDVEVPKLKIGGLWLLGATNPDQSKWFIAGDFMGLPQIIEFAFPS